jgi:hypothetical protein
LADEEGKETALISPKQEDEEEKEEANNKTDFDGGKDKYPVDPSITKTPANSKGTISKSRKINEMLILPISLGMH